MGRPLLSKPTIVVSIDGRLLAWTDGHLGGDRELVSLARTLSEDRSLVHIPLTLYPYVACINDKNNRVGAVAAMMGVNPGRAQIIQLDDDTRDMILEGRGSMFSHLLKK